MLSKRSRNPPCPGRKRPESLTPASRLSRDSARSPHTAATDTAAPMSTYHHSPAAGRIRKYAPTHTAMVPSVPAANPSHDFLGEICGAILCRPIVAPTTYANVSLAHTLTIMARTISVPESVSYTHL